jgi:hypothetical protein
VEQPTGQVVHAMAPVAEYLPAGQFVQVSEVDEDANVPAGQSAHTGDPVAEANLPGPQAIQSVKAAAPGREDLPTGQSRHEFPELSRTDTLGFPYFPASHLVQ